MAGRTTAVTRAQTDSPTGEERLPLESLRPHPQAELVPTMNREGFAAFVAGVERDGILVPLDVTAAGVVLDGKERLRAARQLGLVAVPVRRVAPEDEVDYMFVCALQRRQLTASQKAALAVERDDYQHQIKTGRRRQRANLRNNRAGGVVATLPPRQRKSRDEAAGWAGCSARTVQDAATVRDHDALLFAQIKAGKLAAHTGAAKVRRRAIAASVAAAPPLPRGPFELVYADPPWQLGNGDSTYAPDQYYPTLPLEQIKQLPLPVAEDALLYLWAANSKLPEALEVIGAWGFEYVGNEVWVKNAIGMGVWTRYRHELLLIGRRGCASPPPAEVRLDSVIEAHRGRHSAKPACVYERLERLYPQLRKVELFARARRRGWSAWGNELPA